MGEAKRRREAYRIPLKDLKYLIDIAYKVHVQKINPLTCVNCSKVMDGSTSYEDKQISPGNVGICLYCRHFMIVDDNMQFRNLTGEEIVEIAGQPELLKLMGLMEAFDNFKKGKYNVKVDPTTDSGDDSAS